MKIYIYILYRVVAPARVLTITADKNPINGTPGTAPLRRDAVPGGHRRLRRRQSLVRTFPRQRYPHSPYTPAGRCRHVLPVDKYLFGPRPPPPPVQYQRWLFETDRGILFSPRNNYRRHISLRSIRFARPEHAAAGILRLLRDSLPAVPLPPPRKLVTGGGG